MAFLAILALLFTASQFAIVITILLMKKHQAGCAKCHSVTGLDQQPANLVVKLAHFYSDKIQTYKCGDCGWSGLLR